jgi:outer membrane biogenesis lipoprotein LolB
MRKIPANAFIFCALLLLAACATASLESQTKAQDQRQARIYFLRESTLLYVAGTPYIKINGQEVGRVANGSYFFVDRPPGTYTITLEQPLAPGRFAANVTVRPGAVYYVKVSPRVENFFIGVAAGMAGQVFEAIVSENSGPYSLTPLDEKAGVALLEQLKA